MSSSLILIAQWGATCTAGSRRLSIQVRIVFSDTPSASAACFTLMNFIRVAQ